MSLGYGLFNLNQAQAGPAQLSQNQQGLLNNIGNALNPRPMINVQDPASLQQAAQYEMQKGNTVEGTRLMQQAQNAMQRQQKQRADDISSTYAKMKAQGPETLRQFEQGLVKGGHADILAQVKEKEMEREVLEMEVGSARDAVEAKKLINAYYGATTPQGKEQALVALRESGYGDQATKIERSEASFALEQDVMQLEMEVNQTEQARQRIDQQPVIVDEDDFNKWIQTQPEQHRQYITERRMTYLTEKAAFDKAMAGPKKLKPLDNAILTEIGLTQEVYQGMLDGSENPAKVNKDIIDKVIAKRARDAAGTSPTAIPSSTYTRVGKIADEMITTGDFEELEPYSERIGTRMTELLSFGEAKNPAEAFEKAKAEIEESIAGEQTKFDSGKRRRERRTMRGTQEPAARSTEQQVRDLSDAELDAAIENARNARQ